MKHSPTKTDMGTTENAEQIHTKPDTDYGRKNLKPSQLVRPLTPRQFQLALAQTPIQWNVKQTPPLSRCRLRQLPSILNDSDDAMMLLRQAALKQRPLGMQHGCIIRPMRIAQHSRPHAAQTANSCRNSILRMKKHHRRSKILHGK